ncbi:hypothetical protein WA026_000247 [Henosepilachna vigintioctopunctata]|uniref:Putative inorganic phosphate cotransporter n=1 Tax=Henosepilachna vigintioctopunctata TaxID=420089 RepID=A0AAW1V4A7_9CUCU
MWLINYFRMGQRHIQIVMLFFAGFIAYGIRAVMSVGIVAMTSENPPDDSIPTYPEWEGEGQILSSFFWGYIILQVVAGQIAEKYGPKKFLAGALTLASLLNCFIPLTAAKFGKTGVIINRAAQGLCQGFLYPSTHYILSKWTPLKERSRIAGFVYFGGQFGTAVSMVITGAISDTKLGWPYVFYLYGIFGFVWAAFYTWLGCNSPAEHKSISFEERKYIEQTTEITNVEENKMPTPWKDIFTSLPFWAVIISHFGNNWGFWTLLTEMPSFMSKVLNYDISKEGNLSALPYFFFTLLAIIISPLSDAIISRNILSLQKTRKLFNSFGFLGPALFLTILCFVSTENKTIHVVLLILAVSTNSGMLAGFNVNHIDISPKFSGTLMGITNTFANVGSIIGPLVVDIIVTDKTDESLWRIIFLLSAGIYIFATVFFLIFGSGEIQSWNFPKVNNKRSTPAVSPHPSTSNMPA